MPNLLDLRRRIRSVKNTQQITRAMKMVSAAKLRRAQERALAARPYGERLRGLLETIAAQVRQQAERQPNPPPADELSGTSALLVQRPERRILLVAISSDTGLAGPFNANVLKGVLAFLEEHGQHEVEMLALGRRVRDALRRRHLKLLTEHSGLFGRSAEYTTARQVAAVAMQRYARGDVDAVYVIGNEFKNVIQQRVVVHRILPIETSGVPTEGQAQADYLFEGPPEQMLVTLLPRYVEVQVYHALLESFASEHAARMNAMDTATSNAGEMIDFYTLNMNRARQAAITKEIIEIVSGAAALEG